MTVHTLTGNDPSQGRSMAGDDKGKNGVSAEGTKWTYKQWYERNKEKLAERRKARYHSDKKYKAKVLKQNKDYREKKAKERDTEKPKIKPKLRSPKQRQPIEREVQVNGHRERVVLFHIGELARALGRSVGSIHQWERIGLLPRTPYLSKSKKKKERLYTEGMIDVIKDVLKTRGKTVSSSDPLFRQEVVEGWTKLGVNVEDE